MIATSGTPAVLDITLLAVGTTLLGAYVFFLVKRRDLLHIGPAPAARFGIGDASLVLLAGVLLQLATAGYGQQRSMERGNLYIVSFLGPLAVALLAYRFLIRRSPEHGPRSRGALVGALSCLGWLPVVYAVYTATEAVCDSAGWKFSDQRVLEDLRAVAPWKFFATAVVLAPVYEEIVFRGLLHAALRRVLSKKVAIPLSAAAFALIHLSPAQMPSLFVLGLALAWVYERTGTLAAPVVFHAAFNGLTFLTEMIKR